MWITSKEFRKKYGISSQLLYNLKKAGKVKTKVVLDGTNQLIWDEDQDQPKDIALYCRVSSAKQKNDLESQEKFLREYAIAKGENPKYVISDIASGMNEERKGFNDLIDLVLDKKIYKVIISHKDRLTRFGFGYLKSLFLRFGVEIEIVNLETEKTFQEELSEDLIAIIHHFSMRFYGSRRNKCKKLEENAKSLEELV